MVPSMNQALEMVSRRPRFDTMVLQRDADGVRDFIAQPVEDLVECATALGKLF